MRLMKRFVFTFLLLCFSGSIHAQIDSEKKLKIVPAQESKKDSASTVSITPAKPITNTSTGLNIPKTAPTLEFPKKKFSMFPEEQFGNPGELYEKRFEKAEQELLPEGHGENSGLKEDTFWGDYRTNSNYVYILYRDYGAIDGDLLRILVDDDVLKPREYLTEGYKGFKLKLKEGFNKIDFYAINEGSSIPNTADYKIVDENNKVITNRVWPLSAGVKVTVILVKE